MAKDMSAPNWKRTYGRLLRNIAELRELGCEVTTPENFDKPPTKRAVVPADRPL